MPTIECKKAVEAANPKAFSTFCNPKPKSSTFGGQPTPKPLPVHFPDNYHPPDIPPQDVDRSCHLSDSTSTTKSLNETCSCTPQVTICCIWILPVFHLNYKTPQVLKLILFLIFRALWTTTNFHQKMFSVNNMTMTCSYSIKRLMLHLTVSIIRTVMLVKR